RVGLPADHAVPAARDHPVDQRPAGGAARRPHGRSAGQPCGEPTDRDPPRRDGALSALLNVSGLTKRFGGVAAVNGCSFEVAEGTITALIGPNGSGKTTAFNMITGYLPSDSGS